MMLAGGKGLNARATDSEMTPGPRRPSGPTTQPVEAGPCQQKEVGDE